MGSANYEQIPDEHEAQIPDRANKRDLVAFWICGLLNNFGYIVMLSAALDMLDCAHLSPAAVLLADIFPCFLAQLVAPWFMNRIPYAVRIIFCAISAVISFLLPAFFVPVWVRLLGVVCASISSGLGEITFLAYSSRYHKNTVSAWSSGTGAAGVAGSFSYLGLRYLFNAKYTLIVSSPLPLGMLVAYFFIMSKPERRRFVDIDNPPTKSSSIFAEDAQDSLSMKRKLMLMAKLLPYMTPLAIVYFAEYLINQSVSPVLLFANNSTFSGKEYVYYQALYQIGVFISRSSVNFVPIKNVYLLQLPAVFQTVNAIVLSVDAAVNFIPNIYVTFVIILWEGLMGGSIYVNTFYLISQRFTGKEKEFCLGGTSMSYGLSITICAIVGIFYTPFLYALRHGPHFAALLPSTCANSTPRQPT
jgi:battenin